MAENCPGKIRETHNQFQTYFCMVTNVTTKRNKSIIFLTYPICIPAIIFNPYSVRGVLDKLFLL